MLLKRIFTDFKGWSKKDYLWLLVAVGTILSLQLYWHDTLLGTASALSNILCVILVAKGKISNYFWGLIGVLTYGTIAYMNRIYGDAMLNFMFYLPVQFIGYKMWKNQMEGETVKHNYLANRKRLLVALASIIIIFGYSVFLKHLGGRTPLLDSTSTVLSIIATIFMVYGYAEQWICWIIVNIVSIAMWVFPFIQGEGSISVLVMWVIFLLNSIYGAYCWFRE